MPQGRKKVPFSGKAKKQQMKLKKKSRNEASDDDSDSEHSKVLKINRQPTNSNDKNRFNLQFFKESTEELKQRKIEACKTIEFLPLSDQEISDDYFPPHLDMPKRPEWDYNMSKEQLDMREHEYFTQYIEQIKTLGKISYFELNLETWRQLWRVLEMSDILLILVDIRYSLLMFPPYLYNYITNDLKKEVILVINKVDIAPPALVLAWREYFSEHYPQLRIVHFTSYPVENLQETLNRQTTLNRHKRKGKLRMVSEGAQALLKECQEIVLDDVDLSSWQEKINEEINLDDDCDANRKDNIIIEKNDTSFVKHDKYANGTLTIGCIGYPNVGKSAFMNAVIGNKVVSVSRTPGHTKHFQTIFLTENVRFCDCPGLVFPSTVPKQLQILMGSFPISQVREPYTVVKYLAQRIDLPKILKIQHQQNDDAWSAMDICDSWAAKRHYMTARTGKFDTYRAANSLLRMALEGKICIFMYPPGWTLDRAKWENHSDIEKIKRVQGNKHGIKTAQESDFSSSENSEYDEKSQSKHNDEDDTDEDTNEESAKLSTVKNKFDVLASYP